MDSSRSPPPRQHGQRHGPRNKPQGWKQQKLNDGSSRSPTTYPLATWTTTSPKDKPQGQRQRSRSQRQAPRIRSRPSKSSFLSPVSTEHIFMFYFNISKSYFCFPNNKSQNNTSDNFPGNFLRQLLPTTFCGLHILQTQQFFDLNISNKNIFNISSCQ